MSLANIIGLVARLLFYAFIVWLGITYTMVARDLKSGQWERDFIDSIPPQECLPPC